MVLGVIPARYASTRFPGKPLATLHGRPLIEHVYRRAARIRGWDRLLVATDDDRIASVVAGFGGEVVRTSGEHATGTDRIGEVVRSLDPAPEWILNLQGDEPLLPVEPCGRLIEALKNRPEAIWTIAHEITDEQEFARPSVVKIACASDGRALYFSRSPIPHLREMTRASAAGSGYHAPRLRHVGIYGFSRARLFEFLDAPRSPLERAEELEQLRALELGIEIRVLRARQGSPGVDTEEDLAALAAMYPTLAAIEAAGE